MPSTYSDLKIELMATGEKNTTWGVITNFNLEAVEEAVVGSTDVAFSSGNVTLTLVDTNASQPARNLRLRCTGTTGGSTRDLVVPAIEKPYIVRNDCADSIVVKTAAGTGITVPTGRTMWVYSDGTNVVDAVTHLSSLTLSTALPIAQGGTGATAASAARTNLGATTVGSNIFTLADPSAITFLRINADNTTTARAAADFRTDIGATTVGANLFTLANPSAITFLRINADNTATARSAADFRSDIGAGTGTVTSVGGTGNVNGITLTGTVTSSGNLTLGGTLSGVSLTTQVTGTLPIGNGGTGATTAAAARTGLGATTVGANLFTLTNPSAIRFLRFNADNTVTARAASDFRGDIGAAASGANTDITSLNQSVTITASGTIAADTLGFRGLPQEAKTAAYTLALADAGKHISITTGGITIPANGSVAFPVGTTIVVYNNSASAQNIAITTDTLRLAGTATTGTRSLAQRGLATLVKVTSTEWVATGNVT
jgi:hypothetical protein